MTLALFIELVAAVVLFISRRLVRGSSAGGVFISTRLVPAVALFISRKTRLDQVSWIRLDEMR